MINQKLISLGYRNNEGFIDFHDQSFKDLLNGISQEVINSQKAINSQQLINEEGSKNQASSYEPTSLRLIELNTENKDPKIKDNENIKQEVHKNKGSLAYYLSGYFMNNFSNTPPEKIENVIKKQIMIYAYFHFLNSNIINQSTSKNTEALLADIKEGLYPVAAEKEETLQDLREEALQYQNEESSIDDIPQYIQTVVENESKYFIDNFSTVKSTNTPRSRIQLGLNEAKTNNIRKRKFNRNKEINSATNLLTAINNINNDESIAKIISSAQDKANEIYSANDPAKIVDQEIKDIHTLLKTSLSPLWQECFGSLDDLEKLSKNSNDASKEMTLSSFLAKFNCESAVQGKDLDKKIKNASQIETMVTNFINNANQYGKKDSIHTSAFIQNGLLNITVTNIPAEKYGPQNKQNFTQNELRNMVDGTTKHGTAVGLSGSDKLRKDANAYLTVTTKNTAINPDNMSLEQFNNLQKTIQEKLANNYAYNPSIAFTISIPFEG